MKDIITLLKPIPRSQAYWIRSFGLSTVTLTIAIVSCFGFFQAYKAIGFKSGPQALVYLSMMVPLVPAGLFHVAAVRRLDRWGENNADN